jgi:hypothetical protein
MKSIVWISAFLVLSSLTVSKWVKSNLPNGVTVTVPEELAPMTPEDIALRFPSVRAPLGAFTNQERLIDFSVNISATNWPDGDAELARKFFKASLQNLYDRLDMIKEGTQVIKKKKYIFFEFESRISGDRRVQGLGEPIVKYVYIQYLVLKDKTLVFTFSCPKDRREEWQGQAHEIMNRIRVN